MGSNMTKISTHFQRFKTEEQRFFEKVIKLDNGCWGWTSAVSHGRGMFYVNGKTVKAYRYIYELNNGPIQHGLFVMHSCDNPICVNPDHLSIGTAMDNKIDSMQKKRHAVGVRNGGGTKLNENSIIRIKILDGVFSSRKTAKALNMSHTVIKRIRRGMLWKHIQNRSTI
jgi:hypothetical protein